VLSSPADAEPTDQIDEIRRGLQRRCIALCHDRTGKAPRAWKLTVFREDPLQIFGGQACEQRCGRFETALAIHAHVEGTLLPPVEPKAPVGRVELMGRDAEVEHDSIDPCGTQFLGDVVEAPKGSLNELNALAEAFESLARFANRVAVEVESDQAAIWSGSFEDRGSVTAAAKGSVYDQGAGFEIELSESFVE
jgi:hypothetical protein